MCCCLVVRLCTVYSIEGPDSELKTRQQHMAPCNNSITNHSTQLKTVLAHISYIIDLLHKTGWVTSTLTPDSTDTPRFSRLHILVYFTQNDPKLAYLAMFALAVLQD